MTTYQRGGATASGASSSLIARTVYNPGTQVQYATTSATHGDVDATNLTVTFVVPSSGIVRVFLSARIAAGSATGLAWSLREGASVVAGNDVGYNSVEQRAHAIFYVTGLTPGASVTYKWGQARTVGSGGAETRAGGTNTQAGAAVMEVWAP